MTTEVTPVSGGGRRSRDRRSNLTLRSVAYEINAAPSGHPRRHLFVVRVEDRGNDTWAVVDGAMCLDVDGNWARELSYSERTPEWLQANRFTRMDAVIRAKQAAEETWRTYEQRKGGGSDGPVAA